MKILMLGWELPPLNSGGLGVACYHLCRHLADAGVAIDFVLPYPMPAEHAVPFMKLHAASASYSAATGPYSTWSTQLQAQQNHYHRTVERLATTATYDAIHAHDWLTFQAGVHAKKITGRPLVAHVHSTEYDRSAHGGGNPLVHEIEATCLLMADRVVAVSNATRSILTERYKIPAHKIDVVYNAGDPTLAAEPDNSQNAYHYLKKMQQQGYKIVVSLGRLTVQKGITQLLKAAQKALQKDPKLIFAIIGDGEQRNELIALSAELGISANVVFAGFVRGKQWRDAYDVADMFVMSSVSEPFGLTALEAAGTGTAVILTKQTGASEILPSVLRFDFWDTDRLADYIINVAQHHTLRRTLAANAQREVGLLSWQKASQQLSQLYQNLAGATA